MGFTPSKRKRAVELFGEERTKALEEYLAQQSKDLMAMGIAYKSLDECLDGICSGTTEVKDKSMKDIWDRLSVQEQRLGLTPSHPVLADPVPTDADDPILQDLAMLFGERKQSKEVCEAVKELDESEDPAAPYAADLLAHSGRIVMDQ